MARATGMPLARPYRVDANLILIGDMSDHYESKPDRVAGDVVEVGALDGFGNVLAVAATVSGVGTVAIQASQDDSGPWVTVGTITANAQGGQFETSLNGKQIRDLIGEDVRFAKAVVSGSFADGLQVYLQPSIV